MGGASGQKREILGKKKFNQKKDNTSGKQASEGDMMRIFLFSQKKISRKLLKNAENFPCFAKKSHPRMAADAPTSAKKTATLNKQPLGLLNRRPQHEFLEKGISSPPLPEQ
jgi:hypothetical protein